MLKLTIIFISLLFINGCSTKTNGIINDGNYDYSKFSHNYTIEECEELTDIEKESFCSDLEDRKLQEKNLQEQKEQEKLQEKIKLMELEKEEHIRKNQSNISRLKENKVMGW